MRWESAAAGTVAWLKSGASETSTEGRLQVALIPSSDGGKRRTVGFHEGHHHHAPPPLGQVRIPSHHVAAAAAIWSGNPALSPAEAIAGNYAFDPTHPAHRPPITEIDLKYSTSRQASILRDKGLAYAGIPREIKHAAQSRHLVGLDNLSNLAKSTGGFVRQIVLENGAITFPLQTESMRDWLNQSDSEELAQKRSIGRAGLSTDAHNTFLDGAWILIVTVVFLDGPSQWFPVYLTIADAETTEVYRRHFRGVLDSFDSDHSLNDIDGRFLHVADFSSAQGRGFQEAYMDYCMRRAASRNNTMLDSSADADPTTPEAAKQRCATLMRGCERHFEANVHRSAARFADDGSRDAYVGRAKALFASRTADEVTARRAKFLQEFPRAKGCLDWWSKPRILSLIMRVEMAMSDTDQAAMPTTSNAVEAAHKVLICRAGGEKFGLEAGLAKLATLINSYEAKVQAASAFFSYRSILPVPHTEGPCRCWIRP